MTFLPVWLVLAKARETKRDRMLTTSHLIPAWIWVTIWCNVGLAIPTNSTAWSLLRSAPLGTLAAIAGQELSRAKHYRYDPSHLYSHFKINSPAFNLTITLIACFHITVYPCTKGMLYNAYYTRTGLRVRDNTALLPAHFTCANPP